MNELSAIESREKGQFPLSIATSLAIEGGLGIHPDRPEDTKNPLLEAQMLFVNLRTVFRNLYNSIKKEERVNITVNGLRLGLEEDCAILQSLMERQPKAISCAFYLSHYKHLTHKHFPGAIFKQPTTPSQKEYSGYEQQVLEAFLKSHQQENILQFDEQIKGRYPKTLIITHLPVDLLALYQFQSLKLLESHTGIVKAQPLWYTKLTGQPEHMPLNPFTLSLFGDSVQFLGQRPKLKQTVIELAKRDKWTALSGKERISKSIDSLPNDTIKTELLRLT